MIFRFVFFLLLLLPNLAFGATATLTINVASNTILPNGTYVLANAAPPVDAVDATANPPTAPTATYLSPQQWIWDGTRLDSVSRKGSGTEFLADGNSGLPTMNSTGDIWTTAPILVGGSKTPNWTFRNSRTGNYLTIATGTGILSMLSSGTQTPTTWVTASGATIAPTTISLTTGTTGTVATFTCLNGSISQPCDTTQTWSTSGLPAWLTLNASTGVLTTNSTPIVGSYTFTVSYGPYGPLTVPLTVTSSTTLASGTYTLSLGGLSIGVGGTLGNTPNMFTPTSSTGFQWTWDNVAATWISVYFFGTFPAYLSDNNSGLPLVGGVVDTWSVVANGSGWNIKDLRTNNYLTVQTGTGTLSMIPSGTQTPTVWIAGLVTTPPPQPSATLSASPTSVITGGSSVLTWSSTNASTCTGSNFSTGGATGDPTPATATVFPTAPQVIYGINCAGATASVTIPVTGANTATLTATPITISSGGSSVLTWTSNASSCTSPDFPTGGAANNTAPGVPVFPTAATTYHLTCGDAMATATVNIATGGAGACPGGSSGFVPAGYNCVTSSTDEFNGATVDTSKWTISGTPGGQGPGTGLVPNPSGGYVSAVMTPCCGGVPNGYNGSTSMGMVSKFPVPDAPMYMEYRRRVNSTAYLMQFWTNNCPPNDGDCVGEETDIDFGLFNGCGGGSLDPGANNFGICSGMFAHNNDNGPIGFDFTIDGPEQVYQDGVFHIIGLWRQPNSISLFVDGVHVKDYAGFDNRWTFPSLNRGANSDIDHMILNLFCQNVNGCPVTASIDWDYIRVYTPSGLPNGY